MRSNVTSSSTQEHSASPWHEKLGPGVITGAADDDPSGIATYSQAGAAFGYNILWTILLTYPLMVAIQIISARIGRVSGHGLATNIRRHYPLSLLYGAVVLLLVANTINIAADLTAMGAAVNLVVGGPTRVYTVGLALFSLVLQVFVPYKRLREGAQMAHPCAVCVRRRRVCREDSVDDCGGSNRDSPPDLE